MSNMGFLLIFLADRTAARSIGYWRDTVARLSLCPSVCDAVHCGAHGRCRRTFLAYLILQTSHGLRLQDNGL